MKKLVVFDLDGTLLNTIADLAESTNHALKEFGYPVHTVEEYYYFVLILMMPNCLLVEQ